MHTAKLGARGTACLDWQAIASTSNSTTKQLSSQASKKQATSNFKQASKAQASAEAQNRGVTGGVQEETAQGGSSPGRPATSLELKDLSELHKRPSKKSDCFKQKQKASKPKPKQAQAQLQLLRIRTDSDSERARARERVRADLARTRSSLKTTP